MLQIKYNIDYKRRLELEHSNNHLIIVDINGKRACRFINVYRSFNSPNLTANELFAVQCDLIRSAFVKDT